MFDLRLAYTRHADGSAIFAVPIRTRVVFALIAAAVAGSAWISAEFPTLAGYAAALGGPGIAVLAIAVLAALYEERWTFDPSGRTASFRFGLLFLARKRSIPFDSLESVAVETFVKGTRPGAVSEEETPSERQGLRRLIRKKAYASLAIYTVDAERLVVDTVRAAGGPLLEEAADEIRRMLARRD